MRFWNLEKYKTGGSGNNVARDRIAGSASFFIMLLSPLSMFLGSSKLRRGLGDERAAFELL